MTTHTEKSRDLDIRRGDALIVVDVQRDFLPGGALGVPGGDEVVGPLNGYIAAFAANNLPIFFTRDWHPPNHCSFKERGGPWPPHCVQDTPGASWAEGLNVPVNARIVSKGFDAEAEAYSGFQGTSLAEELRTLGINRVFVGGLATDYCVRATVLDARSHGFEVVVLEDAIRGVNVKAGDDRRALDDMSRAGATIMAALRAA
ncbi:MAG TPA: nicotinamidase [Steroidobacteraceae bacterium]